MAEKRILSVGQCSADHGGIRWSLQAHFPGVELIGASTREQAVEQLEQQSIDLVLVNRVFDANGDSGHGLIEQLKSDARFTDVPVMMVSNYDDAQQQAQELGAVPGFGKASLGQPAMVEAISAALGDADERGTGS